MASAAGAAEASAPASGPEEGTIVDVETGRALPADTPVAAAIRRYEGVFRYCVDSRWRAGVASAGRIELAWTVREGAVHDVRLVSDGTGDPVLASCLVKKVEHWRMPSDGALRVRWRFEIVPPPAPLEVETRIAPARAPFVLGEPVVVEVRFDNHGTRPLDLVLPVLGWGGGEALRVLGPDGAPVPVPASRMPGGPSEERRVTVEPGASETVAFDLNGHVRLDGPGRYEVALREPWPPPAFGTAPGPWRRLAVELRRPTEAEARAIVDGYPREPFVSDRGPVTYGGLGHALYVPILEELAATSTPSPTLEDGVSTLWSDQLPAGPDRRALEGLGACPCPEATDALLRLYDALPHPELRRIVARLLLERVPEDTARFHDPALAAWVAWSTWFRGRAWAPRHDAEIRRRARRSLESDPWGTDGQEAWQWAAEVLLRVGTDEDADALVGALGRLLAGARSDPDRAHHLAARLLPALGRVRARDTGGLPPDLRRLVALSGWHGWGTPPAGWGGILEDALSSDDPQVVAQALARIPPSVASDLRAVVADHLASDDARVLDAALRHARKHPDPALCLPARQLVASTDRTLASLARAVAARCEPGGGPVPDGARP